MTEDESFLECITQSQIDSRLEFARFLACKRLPIRTRNEALRIISQLLKSAGFMEYVLSKLNEKFHAEFFQYLEHCKQVDSVAKYSKTIEEVYLLLATKIVEILRRHNVSIPINVDGFLVKLAASEEFSSKILSCVDNAEDLSCIHTYCDMLLKNEIGGY